MARTQALIPVERIERAILLIRGHKVMLDADLAELYGVPTKALNQAVRRNKDRFPSDFMFRLTKNEKEEVVTNCDHLHKLKFSPGVVYGTKRVRPIFVEESDELVVVTVYTYYF